MKKRKISETRVVYTHAFKEFLENLVSHDFGDGQVHKPVVKIAENQIEQMLPVATYINHAFPEPHLLVLRNWH